LPVQIHLSTQSPSRHTFAPEPCNGIVAINSLPISSHCLRCPFASSRAISPQTSSPLAPIPLS
jgi:hypothetical protein